MPVCHADATLARWYCHSNPIGMDAGGVWKWAVRDEGGYLWCNYIWRILTPLCYFPSNTCVFYNYKMDFINPCHFSLLVSPDSPAVQALHGSASKEASAGLFTAPSLPFNSKTIEHNFSSCHVMSEKCSQTDYWGEGLCDIFLGKIFFYAWCVLWLNVTIVQHSFHLHIKRKKNSAIFSMPPLKSLQTEGNFCTPDAT